MQSPVFLRVWMETQEALKNKIPEIINDMQASEIVVKENNDELCRVCLSTGRIPIYGESYSDNLVQALNSISGIEIRATELYPRHLCVPCYALLQISVIFKRMAWKTYVNLKKQNLLLESEECMSDNTSATESVNEECNLHDETLKESSDIPKDQQSDSLSSGSELDHPGSTFEESDDYTNCKQRDLEIEVTSTDEEAVSQETNHRPPESIYLINEDEISAENEIEVLSSQSNGNDDTLLDQSVDPISDITATEKNIEEHEKSNQTVSVPIKNNDVRDNNVAEETDDEIPSIDSIKKNSKYLSLQDYINEFVPNLLKITTKIDTNFISKPPKEKNMDNIPDPCSKSSKNVDELAKPINNNSQTTNKTVIETVKRIINAPTFDNKPSDILPEPDKMTDNTKSQDACQPTEKSPESANVSDNTKPNVKAFSTKLPTDVSQLNEGISVSVNKSDNTIPKHVSQPSEGIPESSSIFNITSPTKHIRQLTVRIPKSSCLTVKALPNQVSQLTEKHSVCLNKSDNNIPKNVSHPNEIIPVSNNKSDRTPKHVSETTERIPMSANKSDNTIPKKVSQQTQRIPVSINKSDSTPKLKSQPTERILVPVNVSNSTPKHVSQPTEKKSVFVNKFDNTILEHDSHPFQRDSASNKSDSPPKHVSQPTEKNPVPVNKTGNNKPIIKAFRTRPPIELTKIVNLTTLKNMLSQAKPGSIKIKKVIKNKNIKPETQTSESVNNSCTFMNHEQLPIGIKETRFKVTHKPEFLKKPTEEDLMALLNEEDIKSVSYPAQMLVRILTNPVKKITAMDQKQYNVIANEKDLVSVVSKEDIKPVANAAQKNENIPPEKDSVDNEDDLRSVIKPAQMLLKILINPIKTIPMNHTTMNDVPEQKIAKKNMNGHLSMHAKKSWRNKKMFKCDECGLPPHGLNEHLAHYRTEHPQKKFKCPICHKSYSSGYIERHMHDHEKGAFICEICGKITLTEKDFWLHRAIHTKKLPFQCDLCPYRGRFRSSIKSHMKSHLGIKKYLCEYCPRQFLNSGNLYSHMFTHKGERPYECKTCKHKYVSKYQLRNHIKSVHLGIKDIICRLCGKGFTLKHLLNKHEIVVHKRKKYSQPGQSLFLRFEKEKSFPIQP